MLPRFKIEIENKGDYFSWSTHFYDDGYFGEDTELYIGKVTKELIATLREFYKKNLLSHSGWLDIPQDIPSNETNP